MAFFGILPFLFLIVVILYFLKPTKRLKRQMNRKMTYVFFAAYVVILLVATIATIFIEAPSSAETYNTISDEEVDQMEQNFFDNLLGNDSSSIDPSFVLESRTHQAEETLRLKNAAYDGFDELPSIYIERKDEDDGVIEEHIYKPLLIVNQIDFSDRVHIELPRWDRNEVVFYSPIETEITYASFQDAHLLSQFTDNQPENHASFSSVSRQIIVHLLVPPSTKIEADVDLMITYLEE